MRMGPSLPATRAIRAWLALDDARDAYSRELKARFGTSGLELAILRILAETPSVRLVELKRRLSLHPATLGQTLDRLVTRGWCARQRDPDDARAWCVWATRRGRALVARAPVAGPVRLRSAEASPAQLRRLARAFEEALALFGLEPWRRREDVRPAARRGKTCLRHPG